MFTLLDENNGLVKTNWTNIRDRVKKVSPYFAELIDKLSPNKNFPLYIAYYPYGDLKGDVISTFLPKLDGRSVRLTEITESKEVFNDLSYGISTAPLGLLLDKKLEYFIDLPELGMTIPWQIYTPGAFFPLARLLQTKSNRIYTPNGLLSVVSGARSVFMLPKIGCATHHQNLRRDYNVQPKPPKALNEHWELFKTIVNDPQLNNNWRASILYFSKKWVDKIENDKAWHEVKKFLLEQAWKNFEFERNQIYYNIAYSLFQKRRNLKPNPYLTDTACHLFTIALGAVPGYAPACDDQAMPLQLLHEAFVNSYGLKKYIPTIMQPEHFRFEEKNSHRVYYSLQYPSTLSFSPKSRRISSTLFNLRELQHIVSVFHAELSKDNNILSDTILSNIAKNIDLSFYHNQIDQHNLIQSSDSIYHIDKRFSEELTFNSHKGAAFASDAPFVRGCVSIGHKDQNTSD